MFNGWKITNILDVGLCELDTADGPYNKTGYRLEHREDGFAVTVGLMEYISGWSALEILYWLNEKQAIPFKLRRGVDGDLQRAALTPSPGAPCYGAGGNHMESRTIKRPLSNEKVYSEKDVVLYLEKFLKGSLCGDCFNGSPWGEKENERLYFALSEIDYGNFKVAPYQVEVVE